MTSQQTTRLPAVENQRQRRIVAMSIWSAAFGLGWLTIGLPIDPLYAFCWLWALTVAWRSHLPWRDHLAFARDWLPIVGLLLAYNLSRGLADNDVQPHVQELIDADVAMFGWLTGDRVPTIWLQDLLYDPAGARWWDVLVSWVYCSHFVLALTAAVVLWLRNRPRWLQFMRRWLFLIGAGLATYFLYPAAPPWWAAENGYLTEVARLSTRGWQAIGLHIAGDVVTLGQYAVNPVAAMPSLHTAFALFVVLFFLPAVRRRWWPLLLSYPLAMTFTLVYAGEHYIIDVLAGWVYVGLTFLVVGLLERWWRNRAGRPDAGSGRPELAPGPRPEFEQGPRADLVRPADRRPVPDPGGAGPERQRTPVADRPPATAPSA